MLEPGRTDGAALVVAGACLPVPLAGQIAVEAFDLPVPPRVVRRMNFCRPP